MDDTLALTVPATPYFEAPPTTLPPARRLGRYAVVRHLGSGGMGAVYVAYDEELHRRVAIKLLHDTGDDEQARARLVREAQALARLSHPNVVQIHDIGELAGRVFVAMEYVEGVTLREWRERAAPSFDQIREVYLQAGRGLAAAHAVGLAHRDFKADNAMIGADGRVRVLDFGLARAEVAPSPVRDGSHLSLELTHAGTLLGTPAYMAPEQHQREPADARSDQFSFCVALYEAFHGVRPFAGDSMDALYLAIVGGAVRPPPPGSEVPPRLHRAILRGLASDPAQRWPSMDALLAELAIDLQQDPSGSPGLRRRLLAAWVATFALIQAVVLIRGLVTGGRTTSEGHVIEGVMVWALIVAAWWTLRSALRRHAHHRATFHTLMIAVTGMTLSRGLLWLAGVSLGATVAAELMLLASVMALGARSVARWMAAVAGLCVAMAVFAAVWPGAAERSTHVVYSIANVAVVIGWGLSSRPRRVGQASAPPERSLAGAGAPAGM